MDEYALCMKCQGTFPVGDLYEDEMLNPDLVLSSLPRYCLSCLMTNYSIKLRMSPQETTLKLRRRLEDAIRKSPRTYRQIMAFTLAHGLVRWDDVEL